MLLGSTDAYCGSGCQPGFGNCKPASSSAPSASSSPAKAAIAPASAPPAMSTHAGSLSTSSTSTVSSSTTSSQATSASLADPVSSSSSTNPSIESLYLSMSATSASASTTAMESSYSPEAASESTADPEIVPGPGESPASLALSEVTASTDAIISSSSVLATLAESPTITAEPSSTAAAPLATSEVASSQVEIVSSVASTTELVTSVEPTTTLMPKSTESQIVPMETETETISSTVAPVISVSPSSESVASSEATPTPVEETLSSSVVETPSPLPEVPTSSSPVSSIVVTSTTSAPVTCNTLAASYNPSFESGAIAPWTNSFATNTLYGKTEVLSADTAPFAPLDGSQALYTTLSNRYNTPGWQWRFTLQNVYIPASSSYNCTVGFKIVQNDSRARSVVQAALLIDNQAVNYVPNGGASNGVFVGTTTGPEAALWKTVGGTGVANAQDQHTVIVIVVFSPNVNLGTATTFAIDNLQCFPTGQCAA
ncbi:hypothetical protein J4E80_010201 [Alternaria sp. BMP 0032]|nr:hypothetical protein J4E80_010201 [Alternaria sp. BMP 0032]